TGAAHFSVSRSGTIAFVKGSFRDVIPRIMLWVDRSGRETAIAAPVRGYLSPNISPDGKRVAVQVRTGQDDHIWIWDFAHETLRPLTSGIAHQNYPVWTPDGSRVAFGSFGSTNGGDSHLEWQVVDGSASPEPLSRGPMAQFPVSFSPDGTQLVFMDPNRAAMMLLALKKDGRVSPLVQRPGIIVGNGQISPDGKWLAYESNESGSMEVFVRRFPDADSGHWQVSSSGGTQPAWSRDMRELV